MSRARTIVIVVVGAWLVAGCSIWPMLRGGPARTGDNRNETNIDAGNVARLHKTWTDVTDVANPNVSSPVVAADTSYVVSSNTLYAFHAFGQTDCSGTPKTCAPLWTAPTGGSFESAVSVSANIALVATGNTVNLTNAKLDAFDAHGQTGCGGTPKTCAPLWTSTISCAAGATACLLSSPVIANGVAYVGVNSNATCCTASVLAFDAHGVTGCSGNPKICQPIRTYDIQCQAGFSCEPTPAAVAGGVMYVATNTNEQDFGNSGNLLAFDAAGTVNCSGVPVTCEPLWTASTLGVRSSPAVANGMVYVTGSSLPDPQQFSSSGTVAAYDAAGTRHCSGTPKICTPLWSVNDLGPIFSPPAVARGNIYVNVFSGDLHVLNAINGTPRWTDLTGHHGDGAPTVANNVTYVTDAGKLDAFDADGTTSCSGSPKTCTPLLTVASGTQSSSGHEAAIANGTVFTGGSNALRAFRLHG